VSSIATRRRVPAPGGALVRGPIAVRAAEEDESEEEKAPRARRPDVALDLVDTWTTPNEVTIQVFRPSGRPDYATSTAKASWRQS